MSGMIRHILCDYSEIAESREIVFDHRWPQLSTFKSIPGSASLVFWSKSMH